MRCSEEIHLYIYYMSPFRWLSAGIAVWDLTEVTLMPLSTKEVYRRILACQVSSPLDRSIDQSSLYQNIDGMPICFCISRPRRAGHQNISLN